MKNLIYLIFFFIPVVASVSDISKEETKQKTSALHAQKEVSAKSFSPTIQGTIKEGAFLGAMVGTTVVIVMGSCWALDTFATWLRPYINPILENNIQKQQITNNLIQCLEKSIDNKNSIVSSYNSSNYSYPSECLRVMATYAIWFDEDALIEKLKFWKFFYRP